jgi:hypothetical protein
MTLHMISDIHDKGAAHAPSLAPSTSATSPQQPDKRPGRTSRFCARSADGSKPSVSRWRDDRPPRDPRSLPRCWGWSPMTLPPWDPDEYDRKIKALRKPQQQPRAPIGTGESRRIVAAGTQYIARELPSLNGGWRRAGFRADPPPAPLYPALRPKPPEPGQPTPAPPDSPPPRTPTGNVRQRPNGNWLARCRRLKRQKRFPTEAEAQAWLAEQPRKEHPTHGSHEEDHDEQR